MKPQVFVLPRVATLCAAGFRADGDSAGVALVAGRATACVTAVVGSLMDAAAGSAGATGAGSTAIAGLPTGVRGSASVLVDFAGFAPGNIRAAACSVDSTSLSAFSQYSIAAPCWRPADSHIKYASSRMRVCRSCVI